MERGLSGASVSFPGILLSQHLYVSIKLEPLKPMLSGGFSGDFIMQA
jgi:hypothetical protein